MEISDDVRFDRGEQTPARLRGQFARLLGMTAVQAQRVSRDALRAADAHKDHFVTLAALADSGPMSQAALSGRTRIYTSDLVAVLNDLEQGGWARRSPDPIDKRRNVISITDAGKRRLAELDDVLDGVNENVLAPLDHDERAHLFDLLGRINAHLADGPDRT